MNEPTTTPCVLVFAVFGDYDANAPDTKDLLWCATKEEAEAYRKLLWEEHQKEESDDEQGLADELPFCDGWQHCLTFGVRKVAVSPEVWQARVVWFCHKVGDLVAEARPAGGDCW